MLEKTLRSACIKAGQVMRSYVDKAYRVQYKPDASLVTEADHESEKVIIHIIQEAFPEHAILSEEQGMVEEKHADYLWIIDPIDGTTNFSKKSPLCCVSIAVEKKGDLFMGGIYNPFMEEFFFAESGKGAFLNKKKIYLNNRPSLQDATVAISLNKTENGTQAKPELLYKELLKHGVCDRRIGSSALDLCWLANGRFDAILIAEKLKPWDIAAGILIVKEANGVLSTLDGKSLSHYDNNLIASNEKIHQQILTSSN